MNRYTNRVHEPGSSGGAAELGVLEESRDAALEGIASGERGDLPHGDEWIVAQAHEALVHVPARLLRGHPEVGVHAAQVEGAGIAAKRVPPLPVAVLVEIGERQFPQRPVTGSR